MYDNYSYQGRNLSEWRMAFHNLFSLGELYLMAKSGMNFTMLPGFNQCRCTQDRLNGKIEK